MNRKNTIVLSVAAVLAGLGAHAQTLQREIRPSPAWVQQHQPAVVTEYEAVETEVLPEPAQPVMMEEPAPAYRYQPQPELTLAPATYEETYDEAEEFEEGIYWPWGQRWPGMGLGPKIGTTGIGLDVLFGVNDHLNLRGGFNYAAFTWDTSLGSEDYNMDIDMMSVPLLLDIYPFGNHFRISAGLYIQPDNKAKIKNTPTEAEQVGNHTYDPEVIGTISGDVDFDNVVAPYIGIGFGNALGKDQLLTFSLDIGVILQSYTVDLTSDGAGMDALLDTFREDLQKEEEAIQSDLDDFKLYPVVTLGMAYHF